MYEKEVNRMSVWPQWLAAFEVFLMTMMVGMTFGWTSPFLGRLVSPNPPFEVTKEETTWIASLVSITRPLGTIWAAVMFNYFGSKISVHTCGFFYLLSWICLISAKSMPLVFAHLVFSGLGMGSVQTSYPFYIGEIANPNLRGRLVSFATQGLMIGSLTGNIMGAHLDTWMYATVNLIPTTVFLATFFFFPHTPHHLMRSDKLTEAAVALKFYDRAVDTEKEMTSLAKFLKSNPQLSFWESLKRLNTSVNRKIFVMVNVAYSLVQLSGIYTILEYSEIIFRESKVDMIRPSTLVTIMSAIGIPACWIAICTSDKFNRTTMLFIACMGFCYTLVGWGINFQLLDSGYNDRRFQWIVIASAVTFRLSINIGLLPIASVLLSELFPPNVKSVGSGLTNICSAICTFISSKNFQYMADHMTYKYFFYLLGFSIFSVGIYIKVVLPETKGKSLQEIQAMLHSGKDKSVTCASGQNKNVSKIRTNQPSDDISIIYCTKL